MNAMRRVLAFALAATLCMAAMPAHAQNKEAIVHFENGRKLREDNKTEAAIEEFKKSLDNEKTVGALFNLGACYDKLGRFRLAVDSYTEAAALARTRNDPRERDADDAKKNIKDHNPYITLRLKPDLLEADGLKVTVDEQEVPREQYNGEVFRTARDPVNDPHPLHSVVVMAKDREPYAAPVKDHSDILVQLSNLKLKEGVAVPPTGPGIATASGGWGWPHWTGLGAIVVGSALVAYAGVEFGSLEADRKNIKDQFALCKDMTCQARFGADDEAKKSSEKTTWIGFGVPAFVLVVSGVVLLVTGSSITASSKTTESRLFITPTANARGRGEGGFVLGGSF
jgi:tetratricopeptide (TPR) repeat protein